MIALFKKKKAGVKGILEGATSRVSTFFFCIKPSGPFKCTYKITLALTISATRRISKSLDRIGSLILINACFESQWLYIGQSWTFYLLLIKILPKPKVIRVKLPEPKGALLISLEFVCFYAKVIA